MGKISYNTAAFILTFAIIGTAECLEYEAGDDIGTDFCQPCRFYDQVCNYQLSSSIIADARNQQMCNQLRVECQICQEGYYQNDEDGSVEEILIVASDTGRRSKRCLECGAAKEMCLNHPHNDNWMKKLDCLSRTNCKGCMSSDERTDAGRPSKRCLECGAAKEMCLNHPHNDNWMKKLDCLRRTNCKGCMKSN